MLAGFMLPGVRIVDVGGAVGVEIFDIHHVMATNRDGARMGVGAWEAKPVAGKEQIADGMAEDSDADATSTEGDGWTAARVRKDLGEGGSGEEEGNGSH